MNYFSTIILVALMFAIIEILFDRHPKAQNQLFTIAFISISFLVCIKYYFGPDIPQYVEHYETIAPLSKIIDGSYENNRNFEFGFNLFCSITNYLNISFWGMTCIISILYLIPIYILFKSLEHHKCLALLALVLFDYNLLLCELRQCLATSIFLFAIIAFQKRYTNISILLFIISIFFHKSTLFAIIILGIITSLSHIKIDTRAYILLIVAFLFFIILPLNNIIIPLLENLTFIPEHILHSIKHHFSKRELLQAITPIYLCTIFIIAYYSDFDNKTSKWHWTIWVCIAIIVALFQYYFLLNRLRSFFIPFVIIYTITICYKSNIKDKIPKQLFALLFIAFSVFHANSIQIQTNSMKSKVNYPSTVFDTLHSDPKTIKQKQIEEAVIFWKKDYKKKKKNDDNND